MSDLAIRASCASCPRRSPPTRRARGRPLPSPAPYYVAEYIAGRTSRAPAEPLLPRLATAPCRQVRRRPRLDAGTIVEQVKRGAVEFGFLGGASWSPFVDELTQRYGVNKSQFFSVPGNVLRMFVLNTSRPLFRNNAKLRQAVNFAVDRRALIREFGSPSGRRPISSCPRSSPATARRRSTRSKDPTYGRHASWRRANAERQGRPVHHREPGRPCAGADPRAEPEGDRPRARDRPFPGPLLFEKLATEGDNFDIGWIVWGFVGPAPSQASSTDGRSANPATRTGRTSTRRRTTGSSRRPPRLPPGDERERAYGELDVRLSRDAAPAFPRGIERTDFVSARVGCVVLNPFLDLTAVCLK